MSIVTLPLVITVNTVAHSFNERYTRYENKTQMAEYYEPAADIVRNPRILVKQDLGSKKVDRGLISYVVQEVLTDGVTYKPMTCNFTFICDPLHSMAQREECLESMAMIVATQTLRDGFASRLV